MNDKFIHGVLHGKQFNFILQIINFSRFTTVRTSIISSFSLHTVRPQSLIILFCIYIQYMLLAPSLTLNSILKESTFTLSRCIEEATEFSISIDTRSSLSSPPTLSRWSHPANYYYHYLYYLDLSKRKVEALIDLFNYTTRVDI